MGLSKARISPGILLWLGMLPVVAPGAEPLQSILAIPEGSGPGQVSVVRGDLRVYDVLPDFTVDAAGNILLMDLDAGRIVSFAADGTWLGSIESPLLEDRPEAFLVLDNGRVVLSGPGTATTELFVYTLDGTRRANLVVPGSTLEQAMPGGIFLLRRRDDGRLPAYDSGLNKVDEYDALPPGLGRSASFAADAGGSVTLVDYGDVCFAFRDDGANIVDWRRAGDTLHLLANDALWTITGTSVSAGARFPASQYGDDPADLVAEGTEITDTEPELIEEYLHPILGGDGGVYALRRRPGGLDIIRWNLQELPAAEPRVLPLPNTLPELEVVGVADITAGARLELEISTQDVDGDLVLVSVAGLPQGADYEQRPARIRWQTGMDDTGQYLITIQARDSKCGVTRRDVLVNVEAAP